MAERLKHKTLFMSIKHHEHRNIGKTFSDINHTNVFLSQSPKAIEIKSEINQWDLIKLKSFAQQWK